jgi:hypothetical protein
MNDRCTILAIATLLISSGVASAQTPARDLPDAANPSAAGPAPNNARAGTADRPPSSATTPDANAPIAGQNPAGSEKMQPEMDSVGGGKTAPGEEKK